MWPVKTVKLLKNGDADLRKLMTLKKLKSLSPRQVSRLDWRVIGEEPFSMFGLTFRALPVLSPLVCVQHRSCPRSVYITGSYPRSVCPSPSRVLEVYAHHLVASVKSTLRTNLLAVVPLSCPMSSPRRAIGEEPFSLFGLTLCALLVLPPVVSSKCVYIAWLCPQSVCTAPGGDLEVCVHHWAVSVKSVNLRTHLPVVSPVLSHFLSSKSD